MCRVTLNQAKQAHVYGKSPSSLQTLRLTTDLGDITYQTSYVFILEPENHKKTPLPVVLCAVFKILHLVVVSLLYYKPVFLFITVDKSCKGIPVDTSMSNCWPAFPDGSSYCPGIFSHLGARSCSIAAVGLIEALSYVVGVNELKKIHLEQLHRCLKPNTSQKHFQTIYQG